MNRDDLIARAEEDEQTPLVDPTWGYRISLEPGETFVGRWRGTGGRRGEREQARLLVLGRGRRALLQPALRVARSEDQARRPADRSLDRGPPRRRLREREGQSRLLVRRRRAGERRAAARGRRRRRLVAEQTELGR